MRLNRRNLIESLEPRHLLTTLFVSGTSGPDNISVSVPGDGQIHVGVGAGTATFSDTTYDQINVDTGGDSDTISIFGIGNNLTQVDAGAGNDAFTITGQSPGSLDGNFQTLFLDGGDGVDEVTIIDTANTFDDSYNIFHIGFSRDAIGMLWYGEIEDIYLHAGSGESNFAFGSSLPTTNWVINAGDGADTLRLGNEIDSLDVIGPVWFFGELGDDTVIINDTNAPAARTYDVYSNGLGELRGTFGGLTFGSVDRSFLLAGDGDDEIRVNQTDGALWSLDGKSGTDRFHITFGNLDMIRAHVEIIGGGAGPFEIDQLSIDDHIRTDGDAFTLSAGEVARPAFAGVSYSQIGYVQLRAQQGPNDITVFSTNCSVSIEGDAGDDTIRVKETSPGAAVYVRASAGLDTVLVNEDGVGSAEAGFPSTVHLAALVVNSGGKASMLTGAGVLVTKALSITGTGVVDLKDNDMVLDYEPLSPSPMPMLIDYIRTGRAGGAWTGPGLSSSSAALATPRNKTLGTMESFTYRAIYGPTASFSGEAIDNSCVLVKFTYYGDADFNGQVNFDDYSRTDAGFNFNRTGWLNGDYDGSGIVNFDDYSLIDLAFNSQTGVL